MFKNYSELAIYELFLTLTTLGTVDTGDKTRILKLRIMLKN
jgi:hypothetical protein